MREKRSRACLHAARAVAGGAATAKTTAAGLALDRCLVSPKPIVYTKVCIYNRDWKNAPPRGRSVKAGSGRADPGGRRGKHTRRLGWAYKHNPSTQLPHLFPHLPQFALSFCRFTQLLPHWVKPLLQSRPQVPDVHVGVPFAGVGQGAQVGPQWAGSVVVSAQVPSQLVRPPWQAMPHSPEMQVGRALAGASQTWSSQAPQWEVSLARFTQEPSQLVVPAPQSRTHLPPAQTSAEGQVWSHLPQCSRFESVSTQAPEHSTYPGLQSMPQAPA